MVETKTEVVQLIERVRRAIPNNADVWEVCYLLERALIAGKANVVSDVSAPVSVPEPVSKPKIDRKTYMRDLMRRKRAEAKAAKGA